MVCPNPKQRREYRRKWRKDNPEKEKVIERRRYLKNKEARDAEYRKRAHKKYWQGRRFVDRIKKRSTCLRCGTNDWRVLVFHHRDPSTKKFALSLIRCRPLKTLYKEINKCDTLCCNCHALIENHGETY